jgi:hypothetical protein
MIITTLDPLSDLKQLKSALPLTIPYIIREITLSRGLTEDEALAKLHASELYRQLSRPICRLWTLHELHLRDMFWEEQDTGHITYPEEQ